MSGIHSKKILIRSTPSGRDFLQQQRLAEWMRFTVRFACGLGWTKCNPLLNVSCEVSQMLSIKKIDKGSKIYRMPRNCYSWRPYVHNYVKWPERESDYKTYNVDITCGAIILSLYMTVRGIYMPAAHQFGAFVGCRFKRIGCIRRIKVNLHPVIFLMQWWMDG